MEDDALKQRFQELEKAIAAVEKRVDEAKLYAGGIAGFFTIWFAVLTIVLSSNYNSDKAALRDFQKDLREDLGKSIATPELQLLGLDGQSLAGQELEARFQPVEDRLKLIIDFSLKNSGMGTTGPMTVALYTVDPIKLNLASIDERNFKYESIVDPKYNEPYELPGQLTTQWYLATWLVSKQIPPPGKYPALIKFYYGKGKVAQVNIYIRVTGH
jgi:hypothetical protein